MAMPARIGRPTSELIPVTGLSRGLESPAYATSVGLMVWGLHEDARSVHIRFDADQTGRNRP